MGDGRSARHVQRHARGRVVGHPADGQSFRRPAVALVPRRGRQGGGALGGQLVLFSGEN
jgi:hypothetical protein